MPSEGRHHRDGQAHVRKRVEWFLEDGPEGPRRQSRPLSLDSVLHTPCVNRWSSARQSSSGTTASPLLRHQRVGRWPIVAIRSHSPSRRMIFGNAFGLRGIVPSACGGFRGSPRDILLFPYNRPMMAGPCPPSQRRVVAGGRKQSCRDRRDFQGILRLRAFAVTAGPTATSSRAAASRGCRRVEGGRLRAWSNRASGPVPLGEHRVRIFCWLSPHPAKSVPIFQYSISGRPGRAGPAGATGTL